MWMHLIYVLHNSTVHELHLVQLYACIRIQLCQYVHTCIHRIYTRSSRVVLRNFTE
jgi:hypothetical protein